MGTVVQVLQAKGLCFFGCMGLGHLTSNWENYMSTQRGENECFYDGMQIRHKHSLSEFVMQKCAPSVCIF